MVRLSLNKNDIDMTLIHRATCLDHDRIHLACAHHWLPLVSSCLNPEWGFSNTSPTERNAAPPTKMNHTHLSWSSITPRCTHHPREKKECKAISSLAKAWAILSFFLAWSRFVLPRIFILAAMPQVSTALPSLRPQCAGKAFLR